MSWRLCEGPSTEVLSYVGGSVLLVGLPRGDTGRSDNRGTVAVYCVIDRIGVRVTGNAVSYTAWVFLFYGLMPLFFVARRGAAALRVPSSDIHNAFLGGTASIAAYGIVIWAMRSAAMGVVSALRETSALFAALIGRVFLQESLTCGRLVSGVIALGALLIGS